MQTVTQLHTLFQPETYQLELTLQREKRSFAGTVRITGLVTTPQNSIRLHAKKLAISKARINGQAATVEIDEKNDEVQLSGIELTSGTHTVELEFEGSITDPMHGLYPCYFEHEGVKKELLATQFESHHAREAFPCIDEPAAKAVFNLTLRTETDVQVLGNMPVTTQIEENGQLITTFDPSPKMSTYLLAFVVGELHYKEATSISGVTVRSWATLSQPAETLEFAADFATEVIDFFNDYFGVPYPLPKSDHVALPDFSSGAMENWGLITYREGALLVDPRGTSVNRRQYIAKVITHELSHQWFGNLVTMQWWDDLWLNESFASLMEYVALDALRPEWEVWLEFGAEDRVSALDRDILPGVQAVRTAVNHPDEINTLFDPAIVYAKGACVLNMLRAYIGDEAFQKGLRHYFTKHQYANTTGNDLWQAFTDTSGEDITDFMTPWLEKPGYPVLQVSQQANQVNISQQRLLVGTTDEASLWPVPLFATPALSEQLITSKHLELTEQDDALRTLNTGSAGVYATQYLEPAHRQHLAKQFKTGQLTPTDRLRLLHDSLLLAQAGTQSLAESLRLAFSAESEQRDAVWDVISMVIGDARRFVEHDEELLEALRVQVRQLVQPSLKQLGFVPGKEDSEETLKRRANLISLAVWAEEPKALKFALTEFDRFEKIADLPADLRATIYGAGAKWQGRAAYEKLFALYRASSSSEQRQVLAAGMSGTRNPEVITTLLSHMTDASVVRSQDVIFWFIYLLRKKEAKNATWQWLGNHWSWIEKQFGSDKSYDAFPRYASATLLGQEWLASYKEFYEPKANQPALTRVITIGIEEITGRTVWCEREQAPLRQYLLQNESR